MRRANALMSSAREGVRAELDAFADRDIVILGRRSCCWCSLVRPSGALDFSQGAGIGQEGAHGALHEPTSRSSPGPAPGSAGPLRTASADEGAAVAAVDLDADAAEKTAAEIGERGGIARAYRST